MSIDKRSTPQSGSVDLDALITYAVTGTERERGNGRKWSMEEDQFLKDHLGYLTDQEMGQALGRTAVAVHLRWDRDLGLPGPSKAPNILTAESASNMLGVDEHKISHWVDRGFIKGRIMAGGRRIRLIERADFQKWVMDPQHWMYFDLEKVKDAELKKGLKQAAKAWGDEWWKTPRVAKHLGIKVTDVKRYIQLGRIKAVQIQYSYGGRHPNLSWKYWFVLKSEATRTDLKISVKRYTRKPTKR